MRGGGFEAKAKPEGSIARNHIFGISPIRGEMKTP